MDSNAESSPLLRAKTGSPEPGNLATWAVAGNTTSSPDSSSSTMPRLPPPRTNPPAEVYNHFKTVLDFFKEKFNRNSIDDWGLRRPVACTSAANFANAFWNGRQMVFGDGDGVILGNFTSSLDVIAHGLATG